jgi:hypothetical protein
MWLHTRARFRRQILFFASGSSHGYRPGTNQRSSLVERIVYEVTMLKQIVVWYAWACEISAAPENWSRGFITRLRQEARWFTFWCR